MIFSGTTYAMESTPDFVDWGSAAAATRGLARSLAAAESAIYIAYVAIGTAATSSKSIWDGATVADAVAEAYWSLMEQERGLTTKPDLQPVGVGLD